MQEIFPEPASILNSHISLQNFLNTHFPRTAALREHPILYTENGQEMSGSIDLLLQSDKGFIILDYKTHTGKPESLVNYSSFKYSNQMRNYARALASISPVHLCGLIFPASGHITIAEMI